MVISIGADERLPVVEAALQYLSELGHTAVWHGPDPGGTDPWPAVARQVAEDVTGGAAEEGILFCWTGTGVCMAANKVPGVRAALCVDAETARGARLWNNANIICLSMRLTSEPIVREILKTWFETGYRPNPTDDVRLDLLEQIDLKS
jgi:ribose 5-phosphate isomerase B